MLGNTNSRTGGCTGDGDCSLNGRCAAGGRCLCLPGWVGPHCGALDQKDSHTIWPPDGTAGQDPTALAASWGAGIVPPVPGVTDEYHLFVDSLCLTDPTNSSHRLGCSHTRNALIVHATAASVTGPYTFADVAVPASVNNPAAVSRRHPLPPDNPRRCGGCLLAACLICARCMLTLGAHPLFWRFRFRSMLAGGLAGKVWHPVARRFLIYYLDMGSPMEPAIPAWASRCTGAPTHHTESWSHPAVATEVQAATAAAAGEQTASCTGAGNCARVAIRHSRSANGPWERVFPTISAVTPPGTGGRQSVIANPSPLVLYVRDLGVDPTPYPLR